MSVESDTMHITNVLCPGYAYQRRYLSKKYEAQTPNQLWSRKELKESNYEVGTL